MDKDCVQVGDLLVHQGFSDEPDLKYGQWGLVSMLGDGSALVRFTRAHAPCPIQINSGTHRLVMLMPGPSKWIQTSAMRLTGHVPGETHQQGKWLWYGDAIPAEAAEAIQSAWMERLKTRSFNLTRQCLHDRHGYSVMGIACDIIAKRYGITWRDREGIYGVLGNYTTTPKAFLGLLSLNQQQADFVEALSDQGRVDEAYHWLSQHYRRRQQRLVA